MSLSSKLRAAQSMYGPYLQTGFAGRGGMAVRQFASNGANHAGGVTQSIVTISLPGVKKGNLIIVGGMSNDNLSNSFAADDHGTVYVNAITIPGSAAISGDIYSGIAPADGNYIISVTFPNTSNPHMAIALEVVGATAKHETSGDGNPTAGNTKWTTAVPPLSTQLLVAPAAPSLLVAICGMTNSGGANGFVPPVITQNNAGFTMTTPQAQSVNGNAGVGNSSGSIVAIFKIVAAGENPVITIDCNPHGNNGTFLGAVAFR